MAVATSRFFKMDGRTRGHSSLTRSVVEVDDDRARLKGERDERLLPRVRVCVCGGGESEDVEFRGGDGRRGRGMLISV